MTVVPPPYTHMRVKHNDRFSTSGRKYFYRKETCIVSLNLISEKIKRAKPNWISISWNKCRVFTETSTIRKQNYRQLEHLLIEKSKKSTCFAGFKSFPVEYTANKKTWMTRELFVKLQIDIKMETQKHKIVSFINTIAQITILYRIV